MKASNKAKPFSLLFKNYCRFLYIYIYIFFFLLTRMTELEKIRIIKYKKFMNTSVQKPTKKPQL